MQKNSFLLGAVWSAGLLAVQPQVWADGTVNFANDSSCKVTNGLTLNSVTSAQNIKAALYWAPTNSSLFVQLGTNVPVGVPLAGLFAGGLRTTGAATPGGHVAKFQVRAWGGTSTNFEQAVAIPGTLVGTSAVLQVVTGNPAGDPPTAAGSLVAAGLLGFTLNPSSNAVLSLTCASNKTVACDGAWVFDAPSTSGGCGPITTSVLTTITNGVCPKLITRTWQATDGCTTQTCSQMITLVDTTPPVITCVSNKTVECGTAWNFNTPAATDNCNLSSLIVLQTVTNTGCGPTFTATRTWLATDACGYTNTCSQTVNVIDTFPPVIVCASNKTVTCGTAWTFDAPTANDTCGTNSIIVFSTITNSYCSGTFTATRTWRSIDACGNTAQCSQTVTGIDLTPPTSTCNSNKTVHCSSVWSFDEPSATDGCSGTNLSLTVLLTQTNSMSPLVVTRAWEIRDACSNNAYCSQTVTVLPNCAPLLTCASNKIVSCTNTWDFDVPVATDGCGGTNATVVVIDTVTNSICPLSLTRSWLATNNCNPEGVVCSQTVTILCSNCPVLQLTKSCPPYPVPPGGTLAWSATITNAGDIVVSNIVVMNNQPAPNTPVFGPITLLPGGGASFAGSYSVPACSCGPHVDTLTAAGVGLGITFTGSATASCTGTNHITPGDMNGDGIVDQSELNAVLANYWPHSQWIYMTNATLLCNGRFQFELTNAGAWNFTVLVSTNATDWTNLPTPAFPVYQFVDPTSPPGTNATQRLYRLKWP